VFLGEISSSRSHYSKKDYKGNIQQQIPLQQEGLQGKYPAADPTTARRITKERNPYTFIKYMISL